MDDLRIYVASLSDYNAGCLHGIWIDCEGKTADELQEETAAMLRESRHPNVMVHCPDCSGPEPVALLSDPAYMPCETCNGHGDVPSAEEWAIHDHEGFGSLLEEHSSFARVAELVEIADELGDDWPAYIAYAEHVGGEPDADDFRERYQGKFDSLQAYAEQWLEDTGSMQDWPELARQYFDFESYARDLQLGGDVFTVRGDDGELMVFYAC